MGARLTDHRIEAAPRRTLFPSEPPDLRRPPVGRLDFLSLDDRRRSGQGARSVVPARSPLGPRLVCADLDLDQRRLRFFGLRRADPADQPLLNELDYVIPARWSK